MGDVPAVSRRAFLGAGAVLSGAAALPAAHYRRVLGAGERVGVGFIGFGLIGKRHVLDFKDQPDADLVAVAEAHGGRLKEAVSLIGGPVQGHADFRKLLDSKDVAGVVVSTPDHWHALLTMLACAAGKDVYVEKPLTLFVREGRWMLDVARRTRRVVQVGTQQRSSRHYQRARELIRGERLGRVVSVRMQVARNILPGFGSPADCDPPPGLDWEMWLGPAPERPYNPNRCIYHFRWFWDYSGGQMTNLGQHSLDIVDWVLGLGGLRAVSSAGGRFALTDNGETPDTQDALFEFPGWTATWSHRECARGEPRAFPLEFFGTKGSLGLSRKGFRLTGDPDVPPANTVPTFAGAHPVGGPRPVPVTGPARTRTESVEDRTGDGRAQFRAHVRNFLDCVRSRKQPVSDLESGHRAATACHLANLSLRLGRKLRWDAAKETVVGDAEAARGLERPYRAPWDRELKALGVG
ncbi:MAG TPA: Gfo/Idh/MocA family oxidoreductase [Gemmataceae bacterium]|jgi:predicted dehydrogenase|nr:Gfo/Idh/MocA family oxidoreductase [Gemmataceae bacterium]